MKHVWKPEPIVGADGKTIKPEIEGTVEIDIPKYMQRLKYMRDANFKVDEKGEVATDNTSALDQTIFAVSLAEKHIKKVDLTVLKTGEKVKTPEAMQFSPYCESALVEIGFLVLNGPALGNR